MAKEFSLSAELPFGQRPDAEILGKMEIEIAGQRRVLKVLNEVIEKLDQADEGTGSQKSGR